LSPELLEDEAIRGDFVLRWAVVGLAFLAGCTEILDARALVHVRTGEWLAANGVWPGATDPFSLTAGDRRWVNLAWGFDLLSAGVHRVAGAIGLSVAQGLLAALTFCLLAWGMRPQIRSWWGSLLGALAILVVYPHWEWRPEVVTLLGTAWVLGFLVRRETPDRGAAPPLWQLPIGLWCWAQCDPRAWIGALLVLLAAVGSTWTRYQSDNDRRDRPSTMWPLALGSCLAMGLHPFGWQTWLAPWRQYAVEYPALREAYARSPRELAAWQPLWAPELWERLDLRLTAWTLLLVVAVGVWLLNRRRGTTTYGLWLLAAVGLALGSVHEVPVAAVILVVIATVQAQDWYFHGFGQVYRVAWQEVLFSRGGRAITVVGLFVMAAAIIGGRLDGPDRHRTGIGLSRPLRHELEDFRRLAALVPDERGFHMTLRQGDALIAAGRRSFVDHRVALFTGTGDADLLALHGQARQTLRRPRGPEELDRQGVAAASFGRYEISHVLPRLTSYQAEPDYDTMFDLLASPDWSLSEILSSAAIFRRTSSEPNAPGTLNVLNEAFRTVEPIVPEPRDRVSPPPWTQELFSPQRLAPAQGTKLAMHWLRFAKGIQGAPLPIQLAVAQTAIRAAQDGIRETPQLAAAYRELGGAYTLMLRIEQGIVAPYGVPWGQSLRYYQAIAAARQASRLDPRDPATQLLLVELGQNAGKADLTYEALERFLELTANDLGISDAELAQREALESLRSRLMDVLADNATQVEAALAANTERLQVAMQSYQAGCVQRAIEILREDAIYVEQNPLARLQLSNWLAEQGAGVELDDSVAVLSAIGPNLGTSVWHDPVAYAAAARSDDQVAIDEWRAALRELDAGRLTSLLGTTPAMTAGPMFLGDAAYPLAHLLAVQLATNTQSVTSAQYAWQIAMLELERGNLDAANAGLRAALDRAPNTAVRSLYRVYWFCLTNELPDAEPPHDWIPITQDLFATE
jgi:tetratricopeptide (TPR) repeat protein